MSEPYLFKLCLLLMEADYQKLPTDQDSILQLCNAVKAIDTEMSSINEYAVFAKIFSILIVTLTKIASDALSKDTLKIINIIIPSSSISCQCHLFEQLQLDIPEILDIESLLSANNLEKLLFILLMYLESLKSETINKTEHEIIILSTFKIFNNITKNFIHKYNLPQLMRVFKGPCLAQLIQSSLYYSKHISKDISYQSITCIQNLLVLIPDPSIWRIYYPGTYSGLHKLCTSGNKR